MRMNRNGLVTAETIVNSKPESYIFDILKENTDLRNSGAIARAIIAARKERKIKTTTELAEIVTPLLNSKTYKKELAQVFQAFRIATNDEMSALEHLLQSSLHVLKNRGRIAIITYHSGEDRIVKDFFKNGSLNPEPDRDFLIYGTPRSPWKLITGSPVTASEAEVESNPRSRSAKLRVAELTKSKK